MIYVGNDIVDLTDVRGEKSRDTRFMERVFCPAERRTISRASNPERLLWVHWTAKETAFKIISKLAGPPVFVHQRFVCTLTRETQEEISGEVTHDETRIPFRCLLAADYVHSVGVLGDDDGVAIYSDVAATEKTQRLQPVDDDLNRHGFSALERESIHRRESALVRAYCKRAIAERLQVDLKRLQIVRPQRNHTSLPPYLLLDGKRVDVDVSLSHHGAYLAWAYSLPENLQM